MMPEGLTVQAVQAMVTSFIAVAAAAAALSSFLLCRTTLAERAGLAAGATLLLFPPWSLNLSGSRLLGVVVLPQCRRAKQLPPSPQAKLQERNTEQETCGEKVR